MGSHQELLSALGMSGEASEVVIQYAVPIAALVALLPLTVYAYHRMRNNNNYNNNDKPPTSSSPSDAQEKSPFKSTIAPANDVWEERRRRGIASNTSSKMQNRGSTYYYAHNNKNSKGGYTDGLRMEDYTMNGPRLLSKCVNGMPVVEQEEKQDAAVDNNNGVSEQQQQQQHDDEKPSVVDKPTAPTNHTQDNNRSLTPTKKRSLKITKYLWDDPGDASGIGTIRIETLPGATSKETLQWKDARIKTVSATLEGEGLVVIATATADDDDDDDDDDNEQEYRLHIPKLYDRATEVRTIIKAKRLLVKIKKKRNGINFSGKSNLEAWPQPQKVTYNL